MINIYLLSILSLNWKPISKSVWNTIQDEGLDQEQEAYSSNDWVMAKLNITDDHKNGLINFDDNTIDYFNRFDIFLKIQYPGFVDLIDYDKGDVIIVKKI